MSWLPAGPLGLSLGERVPFDITVWRAILEGWKIASRRAPSRLIRTNQGESHDDRTYDQCVSVPPIEESGDVLESGERRARPWGLGRWLELVEDRSPLVADGIRTVAAPLPLSSFQDDVAALERALERVSGSVVLAGHAYAGAVIAATRNEQVRGLVYIAALAPDEGETVADVFYRTQPHPQAPRLAPDANGLIYLPETAFPAAFAQNATAKELAVLAAVQRPISPACITVGVPRPLWKERPTWYLLAEQDRMIVGDSQSFMAERMGARVHSHAVDHLPMVTAPNLVLDVLGEAISAVRSGVSR